jgi:hypothetical protein
MTETLKRGFPGMTVRDRVEVDVGDLLLLL